MEAQHLLHVQPRAWRRRTFTHSRTRIHTPAAAECGRGNKWKCDSEGGGGWQEVEQMSNPLHTDSLASGGTQTDHIVVHLPRRSACHF